MPTRERSTERTVPDPQDLAVQLNVKVPWHYREQLVREAREKGTSLNRLVVNALVRSIPPEQ